MHFTAHLWKQYLITFTRRLAVNNIKSKQHKYSHSFLTLTAKLTLRKMGAGSLRTFWNIWLFLSPVQHFCPSAISQVPPCGQPLSPHSANLREYQDTGRTQAFWQPLVSPVLGFPPGQGKQGGPLSGGQLSLPSVLGVHPLLPLSHLSLWITLQLVSPRFVPGFPSDVTCHQSLPWPPTPANPCPHPLFSHPNLAFFPGTCYYLTLYYV